MTTAFSAGDSFNSIGMSINIARNIIFNFTKLEAFLLTVHIWYLCEVNYKSGEGNQKNKQSLKGRVNIAKMLVFLAYLYVQWKGNENLSKLLFILSWLCIVVHTFNPSPEKEETCSPLWDEANLIYTVSARIVKAIW